MDRSIRPLVILATAILLLRSPRLTAQTVSPGSLSVTATVLGSISLSVDSPAEAYTSGSNSITVPFRATSDGSASPGFTARRDARGWSFAAPVRITVEQANFASSGYAVTARLAGTPLRGTEWSINSKVLTDSTAVPLTLNASYGVLQEYSCQVRIFGPTVPAMENSFEFTVVLN